MWSSTLKYGVFCFYVINKNTFTHALLHKTSLCLRISVCKNSSLYYGKRMRQYLRMFIIIKIVLGISEWVKHILTRAALYVLSFQFLGQK